MRERIQVKYVKSVQYMCPYIKYLPILPSKKPALRHNLEPAIRDAQKFAHSCAQHFPAERLGIAVIKNCEL